MSSIDPFEHYQTEDPIGGCRGIASGIGGVVAIVAILLVVLFIVFHPGF